MFDMAKTLYPDRISVLLVRSLLRPFRKEVGIRTGLVVTEPVALVVRILESLGEADPIGAVGEGLFRSLKSSETVSFIVSTLKLRRKRARHAPRVENFGSATRAGGLQGAPSLQKIVRPSFARQAHPWRKFSAIMDLMGALPLASKAHCVEAFELFPESFETA